MINGVTPSGARAVQLTHLAHFRRLQQIEVHHPTPQSDPHLLQALRTRRHNHVPLSAFSNTPVDFANTVPPTLPSPGLTTHAGKLSLSSKAIADSYESQQV
jgi:hypothetical protein